MCGIAGSIRFPLHVEDVQKSLAHRGPNGKHAWQEGPVQLIHTRLAIQELSPLGLQPMLLDDLVIVFNGEIYNHYELRKKYNLDCHSNSDTETLLHLFRKLGMDMLRELDGMFAFCIFDRSSSTLWLARDRTGEKPLYYYRHADRLFFASDLNTIIPRIDAVVDDQQVSNFISIGYLTGEDTPYVSVKQLQAGHFAEIKVNDCSMKISTWWSIIEQYSQKPFAGSFDEALERTDDILDRAVKRRLTSSDIEVGAFLSGGIDSGLISAYAVKHVKRLKTFTISFDGLYNEGPMAREVARRLGTVHEEFIIGLEELENDVEMIFRNYGEPIVDDSIIPSYYVAREAKKNLSVILSGDGGDEMFGGYRRYVPARKIDLFSKGLRPILRPIHKLLPFPSNKLVAYNYAYRLLGMLSKDVNDVYFAATIDLLHDHACEFAIKPDHSNYFKIIEPIINKDWNGLHKIMCLDNVMLLQNILLKKIDIASMAHGLEGRTPFLGNEILEWAPTLPEAFKVKGGKTKYLLRELSKKYLPSEVSNHPKRGFEIPLKDWVDTRLKSVVNDYLATDKAYVKTILSKDFVNNLLSKHNEFDPEKRAKAIFALLSVEIWKTGLKK